MFTVQERERVRERIVQMSREDKRLIAGALVGSTLAGGDKWSDLDLAFGLAEHVALDDVLADWKTRLAAEFEAVHLMDLPSLSTVYRVFLLPNSLQVDISFTPGKEFVARGLKFSPLFGDPRERDQAKPSSPGQVFGLAIVYLLSARACVARGRLWQAEYCISAARDQALSLACQHRGLRTSYGRGFDDLPPDSLKEFTGTLVRSLEKMQLLQALGRCVEALLHNSEDVSELALKLAPQLHELKSTK
jgi:hypothetical protein